MCSSGEFEFTIGEEKRVVRAGDTLLYKTAYYARLHLFEARTLLDTFTPRS